MKLLLTGGTGYIGSHTAVALCQAGHDVVLLDNLSNSKASVLERLQRSNANTGQRILFQLEFNGFSRIGSNPLQTLRDNVPRYQSLRDVVKTPSRFGRYE